MKKFKFQMDYKKLTTPDNCEEATVRTGREEEFTFHALGIETWAKENPKQFEELYNALFPKKKRNKKSK